MWIGDSHVYHAEEDEWDDGAEGVFPFDTVDSLFLVWGQPLRIKSRPVHAIML